MFSLFRLCRKDKISLKSHHHYHLISTFQHFDIVAKHGNNVEATFDFVERIVRLIAFHSIASKICWCGRGFTAIIYKLSTTSMKDRVSTMS